MSQDQTNKKPSSQLLVGAAASINQTLLQTPLHKLLDESLEMSPAEMKERVLHLRALRASPVVLRQQIESDEELGDEARKPSSKRSEAAAKKQKELLDKYS